MRSVADLKGNRCVLAAPLALAVIAGSARSAEVPVSWAAASDGVWSMASQWNPMVVPDNLAGVDTYLVSINAPEPFVAGPNYTVTLDNNFTISRFEMLSARAILDLGPSTLTVLGDYRQTGSRLFGAGTGVVSVMNSGIATLDGALLEQVDQFNVGVDGEIAFEGNAGNEICDSRIGGGGKRITWRNNGDITFLGTSALTNGVDSDFVIEGDGTLSWTNAMGGAGADLTNDGTIQKTSSGTTSFTNIAFTNAGTLQVDAGTFMTDSVDLTTVPGTLVGGAWLVNDGAALDFAGGQVLNNAGAVTLTGTGSSFTALTDFVQRNEMTGSLTLAGGRDVTTANGDFTNDGTLVVGPGSDFEVGGGAALGNVTGGTMSGGTFNLQGRLRFSGANITNVASTVTLDGAASMIQDTVSGLDGLRNATNVGAGGRLSILNGKNFTGVGDFTVALSGRLSVGVGTLFSLPAGRLTNLDGNIFLDGRFDIKGKIRFANARVNTVATTVDLDGADSGVEDNDGNDAFSFLNLVDTGGVLSLRGGKTLTTQGPVTVRGTMTVVGAGGLRGALTPTFETTGDLTQEAGLIELDQGVIQTTGMGAAFRQLGGTLAGNGFINGSAVIDGVISPGAGAAASAALLGEAGPARDGTGSTGTLLFAGDLTLSSSAWLLLEIGSDGPGGPLICDLVEVAGITTLGGDARDAGPAVQVALLDGYTPVGGDTFEIVRLAEMPNGEFGEILLPFMSPGFSILPYYEGYSLFVVIIPAPGAAALLLAGALGMARRRR